jgi:hypothetical protein
MEVMGTGIIPNVEFVRQNFESRSDEWLASLSEPSRKIMETVLASSWYPLNEALIEPTQKICDLFYDGRDEGAWELGRFSAEHALTGVYRIFVKVGTPGFLISRASAIMSVYYRPSEIKVAEKSSKRAVAQLVHFPESHRMVELRMGGWMERALEISGCKEVTLDIPRSLTKGDPVTEFVAQWK